MESPAGAPSVLIVLTRRIAARHVTSSGIRSPVDPLVEALRTDRALELSGCQVSTAIAVTIYLAPARRAILGETIIARTARTKA